MTRLLPDNNPLACSLYETERMIAMSPTWQGLVGADNWEEARARIAFVEDDSDPLDFPRPCCVITLNNPLSYQLVAAGSANYVRPSGDLMIYLALDVPDELKLVSGGTEDQSEIRKNQLQHMANVFGNIIQDFVNLLGSDQTDDADHQASHLGATGLQVLDMTRIPEASWASVGQFWFMILSVHWGDGA